MTSGESQPFRIPSPNIAGIHASSGPLLSEETTQPRMSSVGAPAGVGTVEGRENVYASRLSNNGCEGRGLGALV
ncbi:hypothetical protein H8959_013768 [Pygathrix nigripes]